MLKYVNIMVVFDDPAKVADFIICDGTKCFSADDQSMLGYDETRDHKRIC